eukprot:6183394-Pleurochrysis_carterae.AAC.8
MTADWLQLDACGCGLSWDILGTFGNRFPVCSVPCRMTSTQTDYQNVLSSFQHAGGADCVNKGCGKHGSRQ